MKKTYAVLNAVVIVAVIFWNYWSNTGAVDGNSVGDLSDEYANLFTPAGYAFSIWGLIFLSLIVLAAYQLKLAFSGGDHSETILQIGPWLIVASVGNATWLWVWLHEQTGLSVLVMLVILFSLLQIIVQLNMERWDAPPKVIAMVWWPISIYSGWIAVATIANISAWLAKIGWLELFTEIQWAIIMVSIAALLNLFMIYTRSMREFAMVAIWAFIAIAVRHWNVIPSLQWVCVCWAVVLGVAVFIHGYKNLRTNPFVKMIQKEG